MLLLRGLNDLLFVCRFVVVVVVNVVVVNVVVVAVVVVAAALLS